MSSPALASLVGNRRALYAHQRTSRSAVRVGTLYQHIVREQMARLPPATATQRNRRPLPLAVSTTTSSRRQAAVRRLRVLAAVDKEAVVVGGGPAGLSSAMMLAARGWRKVTVRSPLSYPPPPAPAPVSFRHPPSLPPTRASSEEFRARISSTRIPACFIGPWPTTVTQL